MQLMTERLLLRDYKMKDWVRVHLYASIPEFSKYELWGPNTVIDSKNFVQEMVIQAEVTPRFKFDLAICLKESGLLIGGCGLRKESMPSQIANLGWAINPDFQNKGYATEAARALLQFGFKTLNLSLIYANCDTRNVASYKVMEKLGMKRTDLIKGIKETKGHLRDVYRYEIPSSI